MRLKKLSALILAATLLSGASSCGTPPSVRVKQWLGSSQESGIVSSQGEVLRCSDQKFDSFGCMTLEDQAKLLDTFVGCCERWRPNCGEAR